MTEYSVKIGFWLRAYDSFTVGADSDAEAIDKAKAAAKVAMESDAYPEHFDSGGHHCVHRPHRGRWSA
jgi:hypothetical protein